MTPYALPYTGADWSGLRDTPPDLGGYAFIETRLDELSGFPVTGAEADEALRSWSAQIAPVRPIVVWERRPDAAKVALDTATAWFEAAMSVPTAVVDLDPERQPELARRVESGDRLIASLHDYDRTPPFDELERRALALAKLHPAAVKIATRCESPDDATTLLRLSRSLAARGIERIVVGMGPHGAVTRVASALWNDWLTYAPLTRDAASAPGQLSRDELDEIRRTLGDAPG